MKKLFILLFLASATTFVSCSKDDDAQSSAELILGSWEFSQEGMVVGGTEMLEGYENEAPECGMDYVQFNDNNTGTSYYYDKDVECIEETETFTYTINGNTFSQVSEDGFVESGTIMSIDSAKLKVKFTEEFEGNTFEFIMVMTRK